MPKLRVLSASEVCKILEKHGFERVRQSGSHIIMRRQLADDELPFRCQTILKSPGERSKASSAKARYYKQSSCQIRYRQCALPLPSQRQNESSR
jgi:predicted RNA binding protein YcfA (HicA-like mRNA interferase family)